MQENTWLHTTDLVEESHTSLIAMFYANIFANTLKETTSKIICKKYGALTNELMKYMDPVFLFLCYPPDCSNLNVTRGSRYCIYSIKVKKRKWKLLSSSLCSPLSCSQCIWVRFLAITLRSKLLQKEELLQLNYLFF